MSAMGKPWVRSGILQARLAGGKPGGPCSTGLTVGPVILNIQRLMSANVPEILDVWRMVAAKRSFEGRVPLAALERLKGLLSDTEGDAGFVLQFDTDPLLKLAYVELQVDAVLPLECQRSLRRFLFPVNFVQKLGLIRDEADESALPEEYEALLVPEDGMMRLLDLVEDELVLAVPAVPVDPDSVAVERDWAPPEEELAKANPFAGLASLKKN